MLYQEILDKITDTCKQIFKADLTGVYLHGSMAMGCFHPDKSDIDLLIVIESDITDEQKMEFMNEVVKLNKLAPPKGIELSIVKKEYCQNFLYPTPFELHFSNMHLTWFIDNPADYVDKMKGTDKDLAAHFTMINHSGVVLYGESVPSVFSEIPEASYIDSIWSDIKEAEEEILENPVYVILNLCRTAAYLKDKLVVSKKQGGQWGIRNLNSQYQKLICRALKCYSSDSEMEAEAKEAQAFAEYMLEMIKGMANVKE